MKVPATFELIQAVLDGEATPDEQRQLEAAAAQSPAVREEIEASRQLIRDIEESGDVVVPHGLRDAILAKVRAKAASGEQQVVSFPEAAGRLRRKQWVVVGWAAAVVIALALSYPLIRPALVEQQHTGLAGTMVTPGTRWTEVGRAATPSGSATASIRRSGASVEVHVRLAREGTVEMQWDPAALELRDSAVRGDRLGILCPGGVCPAVLFRAAGAAPAGVTVTLQGGERLSLAEATPGP